MRGAYSQTFSLLNIFQKDGKSSTYGHSQLKTGHPVRSAIHKQLNGRLVLRWVTTWESLLLYVLFLDFCFPPCNCFCLFVNDAGQ